MERDIIIVITNTMADSSTRRSLVILDYKLSTPQLSNQSNLLHRPDLWLTKPFHIGLNLGRIVYTNSPKLAAAYFFQLPYDI